MKLRHTLLAVLAVLCIGCTTSSAQQGGNGTTLVGILQVKGTAVKPIPTLQLADGTLWSLDDLDRASIARFEGQQVSVTGTVERAERHGLLLPSIRVRQIKPSADR